MLSEKSQLMASLQGGDTVGFYEAKTHLAEQLEEGEAAEESTISKHGATVAKLVPAKSSPLVCPNVN